MIKKPERNDLIIVNENKPFLYKLVGTWGYAPHPKRWREMLDWFYSLENPDTFDPYVPGLATSDWLHMHTSMNKRHMTWVSFHRKYMFYHSTDNTRMYETQYYYCFFVIFFYRSNGTYIIVSTMVFIQCILRYLERKLYVPIGESLACTWCDLLIE